MAPRAAIQPVPVLDGRGSLCREAPEIPDLWGEENPCLLMLRPLSNRL